MVRGGGGALRFTPMVDVIPPGESGKVRVTHETPSVLSAFMSAHQGQALKPGEPLVCLTVGNTLMMSDGADEQRSNTDVVRHAHGDVLIAGLGIGMILVPILAKPDVKRVTVVELNPDVIALVEDPLRVHVGKTASKRLVVEPYDIFDYAALSKGAKWDTIYFDIWPDINIDNLTEITTLKRRFSRRLRRPDGWMRAWQEEMLRYRRGQERRQEAAWR